MHNLMLRPTVTAPEPEIIDLTVDDLKDFEQTVALKQNKMVTALVSGSALTNKGPKIQRRHQGGRIKFDKADKEWATTKAWEFMLIQALVNLLTSNLCGAKPLDGSASDNLKRSINCAEKLGFFEKGVCTTKAHVTAHVDKWLPRLLQSAFLPCMAALEVLISPAVSCRPVVKTHYKLAKSAIQAGRFPEAETMALQRIIKAVVQIEEDLMKAAKAAHEATEAAKEAAAADSEPDA